MFQDIKLRHPNLPGEVWIVPAIQEVLQGFRQTGFMSKEAGGILLGYRRGPHIEAVECSLPMPADVRRRHSFERKDCGHQALSDARWQDSGGTITYIGEWHTHPSKTPTPSPIDRFEWGKLRNFHTEPLVFLIVGTEQWYLELNNVNWTVALS